MTKELLNLHYRNTSNRSIAAYPVSYGVPLAQGVLRDEQPLAARLPDATLRPIQTRTLETYADGSIKWLLLHFDMPLEPNERGTVAVQVREQQDPVEGKMRVVESPDDITVITPHLQVALSKTLFSLFSSYIVGGRNLMENDGDVVVETLAGKLYYASLTTSLKLKVLEQGPQKVVLQAGGRHTAEDGSTLLDFRVRYTFRLGEPGVALAYKFTNREQPETGVMIRRITIDVPAAIGSTTTKMLRQTNHGESWFSRTVEIGSNVEIMAGSSTSKEGVTRYGAFAEGVILIRDLDSLGEDVSAYPYYLRPGNARTDMTGGIRQMYPYIGANGSTGSCLGWFYEMENNYPKALRCERNQLSFDIWPSWAEPLQVRRGQSKEHDLYLSLSPAARDHAEMESIYFDHEVVGLGVFGGTGPFVELTLDSDYVRSCRVLELHRWLRYDEARYAAIESKLGTLGTRSSITNKGMWDIGDYVNPDRSWARNNENDAILDGIREYYRREEASNFQAALRQARHNAHVDFIAYDPDPLRQGTMPAHCPEHTDGAAYPSHMWVDGLLAAHGLTGNHDFAEAALAVGENLLRWQEQNPTIFYGDSRECGWPLLAFLRLHEFTHDQRWLDASLAIVDFYRAHLGTDGTIKYTLPHGVGTLLMGYGEFITWRALFFYFERTGDQDVRDLLVLMLDKVYLYKPGNIVIGWGCNDLFPAWAAYTLTGNDKYIEDNYPFLQYLMERQETFPWGGVDLHPYLAELDRRGSLASFAKHDR